MRDQLKYKLEHLKSGDLSESESKKVKSLFHKEELEYDLKNELYEQLGNDKEVHLVADEDTRFDRLWSKIENTSGKEKSASRSINFWYAAAAILVFGLLTGNILQYTSSHHSPDYHTAIAPKGSVSEVILPDGTVIFLNSGSEIKYDCDMEANSREVFLTGEAWFDVQKSTEIPFIVHTSYYDVRVMGTEFNVKAYVEDDEVVTTLEEGSICVQSTKKLKLKQDVVLIPGEQLVYNKREKSLRVGEVKPKLYTSWKDNKLIFVNMSLGELATLLERKYGVEIRIEDPRILNFHYDGTIQNETIIEVLDILQKTLPVDYVINNQCIVVTKK